MRLVYKKTGEPVQRGDRLVIADGHLAGDYIVTDFRAAPGKIIVRLAGKSAAFWTGEYDASVFGAEWIEA